MNTKKLVYSILSAVMFISGAVLLLYFFWANGYIDMPVPAQTEAEEGFTYPSLPSNIAPETSKSSGGSGAGTGEGTAETKQGSQFVNNINFDELKKTNNEIIGWIQMVSPEVNAPVLMSNKDDDFYLSHGSNKKYNKRGSFYIEKTYNTPDFNDPVTIIYGHRKADGSMFGSLQKTLEKIDINAQPQYVVIYLPNSTKIYHIIATIRHDSHHVLAYNNFSKQKEYDDFFNMVYSSKGSGVQLVEGEKPVFGDKILILSTCFKADRSNRYLVIAKELK